MKDNWTDNVVVDLESIIIWFPLLYRLSDKVPNKFIVCIDAEKKVKVDTFLDWYVLNTKIIRFWERSVN